MSKPKSIKPSFKVIVDTREKSPLELVDDRITEVIYRKLETGDYSIEGLENILCIERKGSVSELASNVNQKRFSKELERMKEYRYKFIIVEDSYNNLCNFPIGCDLPPRVLSKIRVSGNYLISCINKIMITYGIFFLFTENRENSKKAIINIMKWASVELNK